jgi:hypothetical protein
MVVKSIEVGKFSKAIKKGLIMLLYKSRDKSDLAKPHLFLNVVYKVYAKVLQLHLQPIVMKVIDSN